MTSLFTIPVDNRDSLPIDLNSQLNIEMRLWWIEHRHRHNNTHTKREGRKEMGKKISFAEI